MNRSTILAAAAGITLGAGLLIPAGIADAHTGDGGLTNPRCLDGTAWAVTLNLTADYLNLNPTATVIYTGNVMQGAPVPYSHQFTTQGSTFTASAHIVWSDGFTEDVGPWTATKPGGCTPPTTQGGVTTTTTCAQAIPPRADCGTATTVATTVPPPVLTVATVPPTTAAEQPSATVQQGPPRTPPTNPLPATGDTPWLLVGLGVVCLGLGLIAWGVLGAAKLVDRNVEKKASR